MADPILDQLKPYEAAIEAAVKANNPALVKEYTLEMQRILGSNNPAITNTAFQSSRDRLSGDIKGEMSIENPTQQGYAGAGAGTLRLVQGVKQAFGGNVKPEDIEDNRSLQNATISSQIGGAVGTALPFVVAPGRLGGQVVAPVIRSSGGKVPSILQSRIGTVADATLTGGILGALTEPGNWEDRSRAGVLGAAGAAVPTGAVAAVQGGRRQLTHTGRDIAIAEKISEDLGKSKASILADLLANDNYPARQYGVKPSSAMVTGDPTLSVWELGSRTRQGDLWRELDRVNGQARWEELGRRSDPTTNATLRAERNSKTGALREEAIEAGNITASMSNSEGMPPGLLLPIRQKINELRTGNAKPNGNVQHMADWLESNIDKATPGQLYEIRKLMTEDIPKGMNDQLGAALKGARVQRMELVKLIDEALDTVSGGSYGEYMAKYKALSPEIASNTALGKIKDRLRGGLGEGDVPPSMGISPAPATIGRLAKNEGERVFGGKTFDQLTPTDRAWINVLQNDLAAQSSSMKAQGIVGSATAGNAEAAARGSSALGRTARESLVTALTPSGRLGTSAVEAAIAKVSKMNEQELARLLQNPQALAEALRRASGGAAVIRGAGQTGGSGGARALADALDAYQSYQK
jgi:hypothetical protein